MKKISALILVFALAGCAQYQWVKSGITQQEANQDHYACLQAAQQRTLEAQSVLNARPVQQAPSQNVYINNGTGNPYQANLQGVPSSSPATLESMAAAQNTARLQNIGPETYNACMAAHGYSHQMIQR